jgi:sugar phosphate isomerase/epimerase
MKVSISQVTTYPATLDQEIDLMSRLGIQGIGLFGPKVPPGSEAGYSRRLADAGIEATVCLPETFSVFPVATFGGTPDPSARVMEFCDQLDRLAVFEPTVCPCLTGPLGIRDRDEADKIFADALWRMAEHAQRLGIPVALEPVHPDMGPNWSFINDLDTAAAVLAEVDHPNVSLLVDTWHLGDSEAVCEAIVRHRDLLAPGVHVNDRRDPTRSWADRALPGEGTLRLSRIFGALRDAEWNGWLDVEVLSDDGTFERALDDSIWRQDLADVVARGAEGARRAWDEGARSVSGLA